MKKEEMLIEGHPMTLEYDESLLGKDLSVFTGAGAVVATLTCNDTSFTLESNGERGEYWLESVMYTPDKDGGKSEESFSDPIHEMPATKGEAKDVILDWNRDGINQLIANT